MNGSQRDGKPTGSRAVARTVDPKLLEMLACPLTKAPLKWDPEKAELISPAARLAYPVRDGVPIMLPSEARQLGDDEPGR
jgi:uncharacterized protein YbaR (Trm112 family)